MIFSSKLKISHVYAFGDSYTDFGNLHKISQQTKPDPRYYHEGRASNGPTWVEFFTTKLESKPQVISFAYGGATSDNNSYPASVPSAKDQVEKEFLDYYKSNKEEFEKNLKTSLFSFTFGGNDLSQPDCDPKVTVHNLVEAVSTLISTYKVPRMLIATSNPNRNLPRVATLPDPIRQEFLTRNDHFNQEWSNQIKLLRNKFTHTTFIECNFQEFYSDLISRPNPTTGDPWIQDTPCLSPQPESPTDFDIAPHPENYLFWDDIHPTTHYHELMFDYTLKQIKSPRCQPIKLKLVRGLDKLKFWRRIPLWK